MFDPKFILKNDPAVKVIHTGVNAKMRMAFSVFSGYQKSGKNEKILEKSVLVLDFISAQFTTSDCTG